MYINHQLNIKSQKLPIWDIYIYIYIYIYNGKQSAVVAPHDILKFNQNLLAQNWPPKQTSKLTTKGHYENYIKNK